MRDLGCSGRYLHDGQPQPRAVQRLQGLRPRWLSDHQPGCAAISAAIAETDAFTGVKSMDFDEAVASGKVRWIEDAVLERYYDAVLASR